MNKPHDSQTSPPVASSETPKAADPTPADRNPSDRNPSDRNTADCTSAGPTSDKAAHASPPTVALVGAGPGDPELLTLRGYALLQRADVVLYDGLSNPAILQFSPQAETICVGKHGQSRIWTQPEIHEEMIAHACRGRRVVRLKGGDPAVFARTSEEITALRDANIPFEVVPGITAALAASSYAAVPVTHRDLASAVALITGHEQPGKPHSALDWEALARFPGTLVVYMGVTTAQQWTSQLLQHGKPPETPALILRRCSLPDQYALRCRLDEVAEHLTPASKIRPPVIVIIGPVTSLAEHGSWFSARPMFGQRVLVTRAVDQADEVSQTLREWGAQTLEQPAIEIAALGEADPRLSQLDQAIQNLTEYDWIAFSSRNGVRFFFQRLLDLKRDARALAHLRVAAVGERTADALRDFNILADAVPKRFDAEALAETLGDQATGKRVLLPRASRGGDDLKIGLEANGAQVDEAVCYSHQDVEQPGSQIAPLMASGQIHWTTVTSGAIAQSLVNMFGKDLQKTQLASLSPKTSAKLRKLGYPPTVEAPTATMQSLCQAIQTHHLLQPGSPSPPTAAKQP